MIIVLAAERKREGGREKHLIKSNTFVRKTLSKSGTEGNFFTLTEAFYEKTISNILNGEILKTFPL